MAQSMSNFDSALKEDYLPGVREQLNQTNMLLQQVEKNSIDIEGRRAVLSLHVSRNSGVGARGDGGTLPTAGQQGYAEERIPLKYEYGVVTISGPTMRASKSDKGSFARALDSELKGVVNDLKKDVNRQLFGTADGVIATCGTTSAATTVVLATATTATQMRQFEVNEVIDIGTLASPTTVASARTITAIDSVNKTLTISGAAVTTSSSHFVFRSGSGGNSPQLEITGLQAIVDSTGTLFNVNPSTYPSWSSHKDSAGSNRSISENLLATNMQGVEIDSGESIDLIVAGYGAHRAYANLLTTLKRFMNTVDLKGGYKGLEVSAGGAPVGFVADRDAPENTIFGLNTKHLTLYTQSDWEFADDDGAVLRNTLTADTWQAFLYRDMELATDRRNAHFKITQVTEA